jgi:ribosomal protein L11 methylase PrmA
MKTNNSSIPGSFRDPSGFVFYQNDSIYRQVNNIYKDNYDHFMNSGLYKKLVESGLIVSHKEVSMDYKKTDDAYKILNPEFVPFISYPYEWSFSQLKDAALTTLKIQKIALDFDMTLKDASAFNVQFIKGKPVFIDTLSFEKYREGQFWIAYRQFCQHFLSPLTLISYKDVRLHQFFRVFIDGIPLDFTSSLLPLRTWLRFPLLSHIHFHAKSQKHFSNKTVGTSDRKMSRLAFWGVIDSLEGIIKKMKWQPRGTEWADYYEDTNYSSDAFNHKLTLVDEFLSQIDAKTVWDLGANIGTFSRLSTKRGMHTISFDIDPAAVEKNYLTCVEEDETNMLPLLIDLTNPSPSLGWEHLERLSFIKRGPVDAVLALALIHHLAISNNLSLNKIAGFFNKICNSLIIEFVPQSDSQFQRLRLTRDSDFSNYTQEVFENEFQKYFRIQKSTGIKGSDRTLYIMQKK